ncbi:MAG: alpha-hydroxy-acid oxidizing protein [Mesorhizobium sp.]|uniref:alpha-hydroxy acid oxidase n=1 Tax=Mesorhizobium sp. TaxID=1871066 RepID=UPI000FE9F4B6|nr:alpha-hydroxy acid oxidase [Mesorhizobium sp.]RWL86358.1 MAG: alpha-hydroxy-acid oxidizing protein [Mesorhizobium sp.]RWL91177.1 MAG: alpha-hydroxy-acid oxidizing protein [Mesorhizobium sp.]RWL97556.1 MAG: alpha-hydroxy-acid oxidizing protein [Mesorhizobium sp.]TJV71381.1 MAG: alpha-hydroxy-acid oxidizing protein [Mesorhizobium sp.]
MGRLDRCVSVEDFRRLARRRLPKSVFEFVDGGAGQELTLRDNRAGFERIRLLPRVLTDVSRPDLTTTLWSRTYPTPLVISPMGSCALVRPGADIAIASAAAARGIPYTLSTMATTGIERMARAVQGPLWFQLYVLKDFDFNRRLVRQAEEYGYSALVVTVDLQTGGKREKDLRNGISIPLRPSSRHLIEGIAHPAWSLRLLRGGLPQFENVRGYLGDISAGLTIAARVGRNLHAGFDWDDFRTIRGWWKGPLIVKGVLHPGDAARLIGEGADAIWVSNHGGRQLDGAAASIDATAAVHAAVGGRAPVLIDSGIRTGMDVIKAKARGAAASAIGRAALFGAVAGQVGVERVLDILLDEIATGLKLCGVPGFQQVGTEMIAPVS